MVHEENEDFCKKDPSVLLAMFAKGILALFIQIEYTYTPKCTAKWILPKWAHPHGQVLEQETNPTIIPEAPPSPSQKVQLQVQPLFSSSIEFSHVDT